MESNDESLVFKELSYKVTGIAMDLHRAFGPGFLEKVYENCMMKLFKKSQIRAVQQFPITVRFEGEDVGNYVADILVEDQIILEIKCASGIIDAHRAQVLNYLKATGKKLGIILNFGKDRLQYARVVLTNP